MTRSPTASLRYVKHTHANPASSNASIERVCELPTSDSTAHMPGSAGAPRSVRRRRRPRSRAPRIQRSCPASRVPAGSYQESASTPQPGDVPLDERPVVSMVANGKRIATLPQRHREGTRTPQKHERPGQSALGMLGGDEGTRTLNPRRAKAVLYQVELRPRLRARLGAPSRDSHGGSRGLTPEVGLRPGGALTLHHDEGNQTDEQQRDELLHDVSPPARWFFLSGPSWT